MVRDYTALPSPTVSGGTTPDRSEEFRAAAEDHLPVDAFSTEPHEMAPDLYGDYLLAELDTDRLQLSQFLAFVNTYADLLATDDLRTMAVGIDSRLSVENRVPRPFADHDVVVVLLLEIQIPDGYDTAEVYTMVDRLEIELDWAIDIDQRKSESATLQHRGGQNDLVVSQALELVDQLEQYGISSKQVTITCNTLERME